MTSPRILPSCPAQVRNTTRDRTHTVPIEVRRARRDFLLDLRTLNKTETSTANSDVNHFSRFSAPHFGVPSDLLGNIGEPLDYGQAERLGYEEDDEPLGAEPSSATAALGETDGRAEPTELEPVAGPSGTRRDDIEFVGQSGQDTLSRVGEKALPNVNVTR